MLTGSTLGAVVLTVCETTGLSALWVQVIATVVGVKLPPISPPPGATGGPPNNAAELEAAGGPPENNEFADLNPDLRNGFD